MTDHAWKKTALVEIATCEKCGLVRLKTLTGEYVFAVKWDSQFCQCPSPYRRGEEEK